MKREDLKQIRQEFAQVIDDNISPQFEEVRTRLGGVEKKLDGVDKRLDGVDKRLDGRIDNVEESLIQIKSQMVTKSYLDDKLADLEGDLVAKLRKEDVKMNHLIEIMRKKSLLSKAEAKELNEFRIFPKFSKQGS